MFSFTIKNMMRYKTRNILTLCTIAFTAIAVMFIITFYTALMDMFTSSYIDYNTGHIKITTEEYFKDKRFMPVYEYIDNVDSVVDGIEENPEVETAYPVYNFFTLIGKEASTTQLRAIGINLEHNKYNLDRKMIEGTYKNGGILIGKTLSEKIGLKLNDNALVVSTTTEGGLNGMTLPVNGIYNFKIKIFDSSTVLVDLKSAQELLRSGNATTEILVFVKDEKNIDVVANQLREKYPELKIETFKEQLGILYSSIDIEKNVMSFVVAFIMFLGSLIIANSIIASIYDRITEIGMLKAIGFYDKDLSRMVTYEGLIYGTVGGGVGSILGILFVLIISRTGLDFSYMLGNMPVESVVYIKLDLASVFLSVFISVFVPVLVTFIPIKHIKRITPIDALNS